MRLTFAVSWSTGHMSIIKLGTYNITIRDLLPCRNQSLVESYLHKLHAFPAYMMHAACYGRLYERKGGSRKSHMQVDD